MSIRLRRDQCCCVEGCLRPARDFGYCSACWRGLTAARRSVERLAAGQDTDEFDAAEVQRAAAQVARLESWLALPCAPDWPPEQHGESDVGEAA